MVMLTEGGPEAGVGQQHAMNSSRFWRLERGSSTMRTGDWSDDSSRTVSTAPSTSCLRFFCSG